MLYRTSKAVAVITAGIIGAYVVGCDDVTSPVTEFGNAELIYELVSEDMYYIRLEDVSRDGNMYILRAYNSETKERGLWYLEPPDGEPTAIGGTIEASWDSPKLSPDKENVVYEKKSDIYVVPVAGGGPRRIYWQGLDNTATQWIDNETVLICTFDIWWDINTVDVNTCEVSTLLSIFDAYVGSAYLSPDSKLLFVRGHTSEYRNPDVEYNFFRIYSTETWEYKEFIIGKNGIDYFPTGPWSPDGTRIGIVTGTNTHLGYFDLAIEDGVMVFRSDKLLLNPGARVIWSPDSKHFLASEDRDDNVLRVFEVDAE